MSKKSNNRLLEDDLSYFDGNNSHQGSCGANRNGNTNNNNNNKLTSYSKILRQYLPDSLNLNALNYVSNINNNITASKRRVNGNFGDRKPQLDGSRLMRVEQEEGKRPLVRIVVGKHKNDLLSSTIRGSRKVCHSNNSYNNNNNDYDDGDDNDDDEFEDVAPVSKSNEGSSNGLNRINNNSNGIDSLVKVSSKVYVGTSTNSRLAEELEGSNDHDKLVSSCGCKSEIVTETCSNRQTTVKQNDQGDWWKRRVKFLYTKDNYKSGSESTNCCIIDKDNLTKLDTTGPKSRVKGSKLRKRSFDLNNNFVFVRSNKHSSVNCELGDDDCLISDESDQEDMDTKGKINIPDVASLSIQESRSQPIETLKQRNNPRLIESPSRFNASCYGLALGLALIGLLASSGRIVIGQQHSLGQPPPPGFRSHPQAAALQMPPPAPSVQTNGIIPSSNNPASRPSPQPAAGSLVANINCNKIRGHVTFTPNVQSQTGATVSTQITEGPPGEVYQWSIHQFPVKPGAAMCTCSPLILGSKLVDLSELHGNLPSSQEFSVQTSLPLFGFESPVGHSLMLRGLKTGVVACATFLPTNRKANYRAKFHQPLSGSVTVFQTAFGTSFLSHLMYSNGTRRHSVHRFDIVKSDDDLVTRSLLTSNQPGNFPPLLSSGSQNILEQREHENELTQCRRLNSGEPLFKNMTYQLSVSTENFGMRSRTALVLPQIPFETFSSVYVIIYSEHNPNEPIACAPLKFVKPKTAAAKFQTVSVQGSVVFSQESPYDPTVARINLQLPNSDGHSYGIDELPMIIRRKSDTRVCPNIREIIYNPHHVEPSSVPGEGEATSDQYAVGDLSGKYGSLAGKASEKIQVNDHNLPLFGPNSIIGRAMTIYSADGVAIACSNVELTGPMTTAFATFDHGIQGQFIFRQPQNDCNGDTYVYIEVSKPMGPGGSASALAQQQDQQSRTLDHNWHIHINPIDSGLEHLSTTDCAAAGPHYNPYNTSTATIYSRDCTPFNVLRCELGDLSSKMFTLEIPPYRVKGGQEPDIGKFFGTDIDLPLCGPVSVVNRSVVVHGQDFGMQRMACSTVIEFKPRSS